MNPITTFTRNISYRRMAIAVLVSVFLHVVLFGDISWKLPDLHDNTTVIEAQIVQRVPPKLQNMKPVSKAPVPVKVKPAVHKKVVVPIEEPPVESQLDTATAPSPELGPSPSRTDDRDAPTEYIAPPAAEPIQVPADDPAPKPYTYVVTEFDAKRVQDASAAGTLKITYQVLPNQRYLLRSEMNGKGLLALFVKQRTLTSEGLLTDQGLQPLNFKYQVENNKEKSTITVFDWQNKTVTFQSSKGDKSVPLPDGAQDLLSFMYQSMFVPPLNEVRFNVTNGKAMHAYDYEFNGEETITTKIGQLNTIHLHRTNDDGDEIIDLWLATDYLYLPVKIMQTNKKGTVELFITRLSTAAPAEASH